MRPETGRPGTGGPSLSAVSGRAGAGTFTTQTATTEVLPLAACWQLLRESVVGRLAVVVVGLSDIFPVNHVVDHGSIVFRTGAGAKLFASLGQGAAFEVDGYESADGTAWSVVVRGVAREIWETNESIHALVLPLSRGTRGRSRGLSGSSRAA